MDNRAGGFIVQNKVLQAVQPDALAFLQERFVTRATVVGEVIYDEGATFTHAVFPHDGVFSLMSRMEDGRTVEKASIGYEGFIDFSLILGGGTALSCSMVRVAGYASWVKIEDLDAAIVKFPCVNEAMLAYAKHLTMQLLESVACNSLHNSDQRIARWLLEADDRVHGRSFEIKQEGLAESLALRRATVSEVCSQFQRDSIISYSRGKLTVHDRVGLERAACECYRKIRGVFSAD